MSAETNRQMPRVLVGTPTTDAKRYALAMYLYHLQNFDYPNYDVLLVDNSADDDYSEMLHLLGVPVVRTPYMENPYDQLIAAREMLRQHAIKGGYDYLLSLESDVTVPADTITKMLSHKKSYVTTVMYNYFLLKKKVQRVLVVRKEFEDMPGRYRDVTEEDIAAGPLITIERSHLGCTLISTELLKQITFHHDGWQYDDYILCDDLRKLGHILYCDTTIHVNHMADGGSLHKRAKDFRNARDRSARQQI